MCTRLISLKDYFFIQILANLLFYLLSLPLLCARSLERVFGNIGDGGQGESVSYLIFWNLKAKAIAHIQSLKWIVSNQRESS